MKISPKEWILFILTALFCFGLWMQFGYPQFAFVNLSIDKKEAIAKAEAYFNQRGIDTKEYSKAVVFDVDDWADRYLQKTKGFKEEEDFIRRHNYELFSWGVRFFKQFQKEEFSVRVSPVSGRVLEYNHFIEDVAVAPAIEKDSARKQAEDFFKNTSGINMDEYDFHEESARRYDKRTDYSFSWEKKGVYIPWKKDEGGAKLLIGATISGNGLMHFYRNRLDIPEKFSRDIEKQMAFGEYLFALHFIVFTFLIVSAIFIVARRKNNIINSYCKRWFFALGIFLVAVNTVSILNDIQSVIISYPTSISMGSFLGIYIIKMLINLALFSAAFILPGIAGESLRREVLPQNPRSSFTHYLLSTFYSRPAAGMVLLGYLIFIIMLGMQAAMFYLGQRYLGVWKEWLRLAQFSSSYVPFFGAFVVGISAGLSEEVIFRLFGISWGRKYLRSTFLAVLFASLIWGFGHSGYAIFPVWFRGVEVSLMGILYGFIFIRYGLIPLLVAHYLFDVFWGVAAYILGRSPLYLFGGSLFILLVPLIFAAAAYLLNKEEKERPIEVVLNDTQRYNLSVLTAFVSTRKSQGLSAASVSAELIRHNWDPELVALAIKEVF